jgi:hypothetical protein
LPNAFPLEALFAITNSRDLLWVAFSSSFFFLTPFMLHFSLPVVLRGVVESFVFLYLGLLLFRSLFLFWIVYGVGVCLAGKPTPAAGFPAIRLLPMLIWTILR